MSIVSIMYLTLIPVMLCFIGLWVNARAKPPWDYSLDKPPTWPGAVCLGIAFLVAQLGLFGVPGAPTMESWDWLWFAVLIAVFWEWAPLPNEPDALDPMIRWPGRLVLLGAAATATLLPLMRQGWTTGESVLTVAVIAALAAVVLGGFSLLGRQAEPLDASVAMLVICIAGSIALSINGYARVGLLAGALSAGLGGVVLYSLWRSELLHPLMPRVGAMAGLVLSLLWLNGAYYSDLPRWQVVALGLAAWPMALGWRAAREAAAPPVWEIEVRERGWSVPRTGAAAVGAVLSFTAVAAVLWANYRAYAAAQAESGGY